MENLKIGFWIALVLAFGQSVDAAEKPAGKSCVTAECHAKTLSGAFKHDAATEDCATCHETAVKGTPFEAGDHHKFKKRPLKELCVDCHEAFAGATVHDPVKEGDCGACHNPHSSANPRLLTSAFDPEWFGPGTSKSYALCFECHDVAGIEALESDGTGFRQGKKNLHAVHVLAQPTGRSCVTCHSAHASDALHLIADKTKFYTFTVPLQYEATEKGGSCLPACHEKKSYERDAKATGDSK